jgi:hypothetical protein
MHLLYQTKTKSMGADQFVGQLLVGRSYLLLVDYETEVLE